MGPIVSRHSPLSPAAAADISWDAVVIGAGPAGSVIAHHLARQQRRVLVVEAKSFPRDKVCGGCISRRALDELRQAGLGDVSQSFPGTPIAEYEIRWSGRSFVVARDGGLSLSRALFDDRLRVEAEAAGADVLTKTTARVLPRADDESDDRPRRVALEQGGERAAVVAARLVIAADGLGRRSLRDLTDFPVQTAADSWIGLHAILPVDDWPPAGRVVMAAAPGGYVGAVRIEPAPGETAARVNVAAAMSPARLSQADSPAAAIASLFHESGTPRPDSVATASWSGTGPLTRQASVFARDRVLVLGDAAGYVEPFTGEGVACAIAGANALAELLPDSGDLWTTGLSEKWTRAYRIRVARGRWLIHTIRAAAHRPWLAATAFGLAATFPSIPAFVARRINTSRLPASQKRMPRSGACSP